MVLHWKAGGDITLAHSSELEAIGLGSDFVSTSGGDTNIEGILSVLDEVIVEADGDINLYVDNADVRDLGGGDCQHRSDDSRIYG